MKLAIVAAMFAFATAFICYLQWAGVTSMQEHRAVWPWDAPPTSQDANHRTC